MRRPSSSPARTAILVAVFTVVAGPGLLAAATGALAQAQDAPPPTPVPPEGSLSPYPTALETPPPDDDPPALRAEAAALLDLDAGQVLYQDDGRQIRAVASLTKVMTALLVVERAALGERVTASGHAAAQTGSELGLTEGEVRTVDDLLFALLLQSANDAAVALAEHVAGSVDGFVAEMNARAASLGLRDTVFFSPNGLDDRGHSSAVDMARLTRIALEVPEIARIVGTRFHDVPSPNGVPRHIQNRNALLWLYEGATGVKTGFTTAAGYCLIATAERDGERLVAVVLGTPSQAWNDAAALLNFGFEAFDRTEVVAAGDPVDTVRVGHLLIPAVAGRSVSAYVEPGDSEVRFTVRRRGGLRLPVREGQSLGFAVVRLGGTILGRVPLVVGDLPDPPGAGRPYWQRLVFVLIALVGSVLRAG